MENVSYLISFAYAGWHKAFCEPSIARILSVCMHVRLYEKSEKCCVEEGGNSVAFLGIEI